MVSIPVRRWLLLLIAACFFGCAEADTFTEFEQQARSTTVFIAGNEWRGAQRSYRVALITARRNNADPGTIAVLAFHYGRASGVICSWDEAENAFQEAYSLYRSLAGPYWKVLLELARVSMARNEYRLASSYMQEMLPLMEKAGYPSLDPIGYAHILEDYAFLAEKLMWDEHTVQPYLDRSAAIHAANPGKPPFFAKTPYGTECAAGNHRPGNPPVSPASASSAPASH